MPEPGDGLVFLLASDLRLHLDQLAGRVGREQAPPGM